jgi:hypothetical protein
MHIKEKANELAGGSTFVSGRESDGGYKLLMTIRYLVFTKKVSIFG